MKNFSTTAQRKTKGITTSNHISLPQLETKKLVRSNGCAEVVILTQWHWDAVSWLIEHHGYTERMIVDCVEEIVPIAPAKTSFSQVFEWWIDIVICELRQLDEIEIRDAS